MTAAPSRIALARRERGAEGVRELLVEVFTRCDTAAAACDELGMREVEAALRDRVEGALVAARGDVDRAADAFGWTTAALETLLRDHPHWWPREELGPRG